MIKLIEKIVLSIRFFISFIWQMNVANIRVAYFIVSPRAKARPGVIAFPLSCKTDTQMTVFAIILSLTPGTLALDISDDKKTLYIHAMEIRDKSALINEIRDDLEKPIMRIFSWK